MLQAQRAAIRTGDRHGMQFQGSTSNVKSWAIIRRGQDNSTVVIEGPNEFLDEMTVSVNQGEMLFDFEGNGTQAYEVSFVGPHRSFDIQIEPLTRMIRTQEVAR